MEHGAYALDLVADPGRRLRSPTDKSLASNRSAHSAAVKSLGARTHSRANCLRVISVDMVFTRCAAPPLESKATNINQLIFGQAPTGEPKKPIGVWRSIESHNITLGADKGFGNFSFSGSNKCGRLSHADNKVRS